VATIPYFQYLAKDHVTSWNEKKRIARMKKRGFIRLPSADEKRDKMSTHTATLCADHGAARAAVPG
jgi:hypothetical protein